MRHEERSSKDMIMISTDHMEDDGERQSLTGHMVSSLQSKVGAGYWPVLIVRDSQHIRIKDARHKGLYVIKNVADDEQIDCENSYFHQQCKVINVENFDDPWVFKHLMMAKYQSQASS